MKLLNIEYQGVTVGGVNHIVNLEVEGNRFPALNGKTLCMSITVLTDVEEGMRYRLVSRKISEEGRVTHWVEDEVLTPDENSRIEEWCEKEKIKEKAWEIADEYEKKEDLIFDLYDKLKEVRCSGLEGLQSVLNTREVIQDSPKMRKEKEIRKEIHALSNQLKELEGKKIS